MNALPLQLPAPLLAQSDLLGGPGTWTAIGIIAVLAFLVSLGLVVVARYKRCPSNRILVIYGKVKAGQSAKCLHGGGAFVWPLIQDYDFLDLEPIQIEIPLKGALSIENIRVNVPSVFTVAIGTDAGRDAERGHPPAGPEDRRDQEPGRDIIFGQLRQVIASMAIEEINRDRDKFLENIQNVARARAARRSASC